MIYNFIYFIFIKGTQVETAKGQVNVFFYKIFNFGNDISDPGMRAACYQDNAFVRIQDQGLLFYPAWNYSCGVGSLSYFLKVIHFCNRRTPFFDDILEA